MRLGEAVGILNACAHGGSNDWIIADIGTKDFRVASDQSSLTAFEAIAIAEKYKEGETPESVLPDVLDELAEAH
jgi:hypothetical protein